MNTAILNTAELTSLHTETLNEVRRARTQANITRRAQTLFNDGYTADESSVTGLYFITGPQGQEYQVNVGTALGFSCDCPAFADYGTCKHFQAVDLMLRDEAQAAEYDVLMSNADDGAYARF